MVVEFDEIVELLSKGKCVYVGYCLNGDIDGIPAVFENDREAIRFYSNYEAEAYKFNFEDNELTKVLIYNPYSCFG